MLSSFRTQYSCGAGYTRGWCKCELSCGLFSLNLVVNRSPKTPLWHTSCIYRYRWYYTTEILVRGYSLGRTCSIFTISTVPIYHVLVTPRYDVERRKNVGFAYFSRAERIDWPRFGNLRLPRSFAGPRVGRLRIFFTPWMYWKVCLSQRIMGPRNWCMIESSKLQGRRFYSKLLYIFLGARYNVRCGFCSLYSACTSTYSCHSWLINICNWRYTEMDR